MVLQVFAFVVCVVGGVFRNHFCCNCRCCHVAACVSAVLVGGDGDVVVAVMGDGDGYGCDHGC